MLKLTTNMIAFQHINSGKYLASRTTWEHSSLLSGGFPFHQNDEAGMRERFPALAEYRTVTWSSRIDHPANDLAKLSPDELAALYPIMEKL